MADTKVLNTKVKGWGTESHSALQQQFVTLNIIHATRSRSPGPSKDAIKVKYGYRQGMISRIGFGFPKHMVFVHKGVGRETPIAKAGTTNRQAKEWFDPPIEKQVEKLGDIVADCDADMIVNSLNIR